MGPQPAGRFPSELGTAGAAISFALKKTQRHKLRASDVEALCSFGKIEKHDWPMAGRLTGRARLWTGPPALVSY